MEAADRPAEEEGTSENEGCNLHAVFHVSQYAYSQTCGKKDKGGSGFLRIDPSVEARTQDLQLRLRNLCKSDNVLCEHLEHVSHVIRLKLYEWSKLVEKWLKPMFSAMLVHELAQFVDVTPLIIRSAHRNAQCFHRRGGIAVFYYHINDVCIL